MLPLAACLIRVINAKAKTGTARVRPRRVTITGDAPTIVIA